MTDRMSVALREWPEQAVMPLSAVALRGAWHGARDGSERWRQAGLSSVLLNRDRRGAGPRVTHVSDMFDQIVEHNDEIRTARASRDPKRREAVKYQRPVGPSSMLRIRETLRSYLNDRIREELISFNPAKWVKLPPADRPKPLVWTPERVEYWQRTGKVPGPVMVWTPEHTGRFFDHIEGHRLYALFRLLGYCGLRRGEGCGLRLIDTHLASRTIEVLNQLVQYGWEPRPGHPKTDESAATVALDRGHRRRAH